VATVGLLYSQRNTDFFGRTDAEQMVGAPERGFTEALLHARIPFVMVHADDLDRAAAQLKLLILPNLGTMTDAQIASVRSFAQKGGGLIASGAASLATNGATRARILALGDLFGVHLPANHGLRTENTRRQMAMGVGQSYLRLIPELRAKFMARTRPANPPPSARATRCCADSRTPTSSPTAARSRR